MKTLYLECNMGAAGDMLTAALAELLDDKGAFEQKLNSLSIPKVRFSLEASAKCGIKGTRAVVTIDGEEEESGENEHSHEHEHAHEHEHPHGHEHAHEHHHECEHKSEHEEIHHHHHAALDIEAVVGSLALSDKVRRDVLAVFRSILEAESRVHGVPVTEVHLHEVGSLDAVADIVGVCLLMDMLSPERVVCSPVNTGSGEVHCAHGVLPVPAPATADLLCGIPSYSSGINGELCTPTGAALIKHFATEFGARPVMTVKRTGYGMGKKDFPAANCLRAFLGEGEGSTDEVVKLSCNLDDMTPEALSFAAERLFDGGALDVWTTAIGMKKGRAGILLSCLCKPADRDRLLRLIFKHTTTLGVRESAERRYILERGERTETTADGPLRVKTASGYGVTREKIEFEDAAKIARETGKALSEIKL